MKSYYIFQNKIHSEKRSIVLYFRNSPNVWLHRKQLASHTCLCHQSVIIILVDYMKKNLICDYTVSNLGDSEGSLMTRRTTVSNHTPLCQASSTRQSCHLPLPSNCQGLPLAHRVKSKLCSQNSSHLANPVPVQTPLLPYFVHWVLCPPLGKHRCLNLSCSFMPWASAFLLPEDSNASFAIQPIGHLL